MHLWVFLLKSRVKGGGSFLVYGTHISIYTYVYDSYIILARAGVGVLEKQIV